MITVNHFVREACTSGIAPEVATEHRPAEDVRAGLKWEGPGVTIPVV